MKKSIRISEHARKRMEKYGLVFEVLTKPDKVIRGRHGRKIAHKFKNNYVLRVIYEENDLITVITVYHARRERYAKAV